MKVVGAQNQMNNKSSSQGLPSISVDSVCLFFLYICSICLVLKTPNKLTINPKLLPVV